MQVTEQSVNTLVEDLRLALLEREEVHVEAVIHRFDYQFGTDPSGDSLKDGCIIYYLGGSSPEALYEDLKHRFGDDVKDPSDGHTAAELEDLTQTTANKLNGLKELLETLEAEKVEQPLLEAQTAIV